jgi:myo-inositol-1(or 4)-monophosphatase
MDLTQEKNIAIQAAKEAGQILMKKFTTHNRANVRLKSKHEVVTPADLASEKIILRTIKKHFPQHGILSEEAGEKGSQESDYQWIIDPLDGTTNFSMGNPLFSISIALTQNNQLILGVIYVPFLDELYLAELDKPATLNDKEINVSEINKITEALLTFCHGNDEPSIKRAINIHHHFKTAAKDMRQIGSAAVELAWVARGKTEAIIIPGALPWDVAAGALLVRQAGGMITDMLGHDWDLNSRGIIASNQKINDVLVRTVKNIK